jgi:hypothetical protein
MPAVDLTGIIERAEEGVPWATAGAS